MVETPTYAKAFVDSTEEGNRRSVRPAEALHHGGKHLTIHNTPMCVRNLWLTLDELLRTVLFLKTTHVHASAYGALNIGDQWQLLIPLP